ncbi:MAG: YeeE/YedE family protein [Salinispira sp.]
MIIYILGFILGLVLGFSFQKGGFCMNSAFRSIVFEKDHSLVRAWVLVLIINLVIVHLLDELALITISRAPLFIFALIPGGLIFGAGMVLAGGCTSGSCYRAGRGMLGSWAALAGFVFGALLFGTGAAAPLQRFLRAYTIDIRGEVPSVWNVLGIDYSIWKWLIIALLSITGVVWLLRAPKQKYVNGWKWWQTGLAVGILSVLTWVLSAFVFRDFGLSFTQPIQSWGNLLLNGDVSGISVVSFLVAGVPVGAYFVAARAGEAALVLPEPRRMLMQLGGGVLMGTGASIAGGCNIGHGITGLSTLSISSMVATLFTMFGVWATTGIIFQKMRKQKSS